MKHYRAQLAVNSAILEYKYTGDWLTEDARKPLAYMGVGAVPALIAFMRYRDTNMYVRNAVARALIIITKMHPETKSRIVASIMDAVQAESDIDTRAILVDSLVDLEDPSLYDYLRNSVKTGFITSDSFSLHYIECGYGTSYSPRPDLETPLYIFGPDYKNTFAYISFPGLPYIR